GEVLFFEAAALGQGHRQRVSQRQHGGGGGGGGQAQRAGFLVHGAIERHVGGGSQGGELRIFAGGGAHATRVEAVAGNADHRNLQALHGGQQLQNLFRLAAGGEGQDHVAAHQHAQIAMQGLRRMEEERGGAGGAEGSGHFA